MSAVCSNAPLVRDINRATVKRMVTRRGWIPQCCGNDDLERKTATARGVVVTVDRMVAGGGVSWSAIS